MYYIDSTKYLYRLGYISNHLMDMMTVQYTEMAFSLQKFEMRAPGIDWIWALALVLVTFSIRLTLTLTLRLTLSLSSLFRSC